MGLVGHLIYGFARTLIDSQAVKAEFAELGGNLFVLAPAPTRLVEEHDERSVLLVPEIEVGRDQQTVGGGELNGLDASARNGLGRLILRVRGQHRVGLGVHHRYCVQGAFGGDCSGLLRGAVLLFAGFGAAPQNEQSANECACDHHRPG